MDLLILFLQRLLGMLFSLPINSRPQMALRYAPVPTGVRVVRPFHPGALEVNRNNYFRGLSWYEPLPPRFQLADYVFEGPPDG